MGGVNELFPVGLTFKLSRGRAESQSRKERSKEHARRSQSPAEHMGPRTGVPVLKSQ